MSHLDPGVIHALLDGEIPSSELAELQAHLAGCAECRARLAEEREIFGEAGALVESLEVPDHRPTALPTPRARRRVHWMTQVAWAASVLMAGGLGYAMRVVVSADPAPLIRVASEAEPISRRDAASAAVETAAPSPAPAPAPAPAESRARIATKESGPRRALADASRDTEENRGKVSVAAGIATPAAAAAAPPPEPAAQNQAKPRADTAVTGSTMPFTVARKASVAGRALAPQQFRLEEVVVSAAAERNAPVTIPYPDAVARLGGRLRQIEGLIPRRLEAQGDTIRVVYRVGTREVVLVQRRSGDEIQVSLEVPPGFPTDSLELLRALVRD